MSEPLFIDVGVEHEICRFRDGKWSLRLKLPNDDRAHRRYLDTFEVQLVEAALKAVSPEAIEPERLVRMLEQLKTDATVSKFMTVNECQAYRQAIADMLTMIRPLPQK